MSKDLATVSPATLPDQIKFAEALAQAKLLPAAYRNQPANVLLAMQYGDALGIPPIQAINDIHIIEGKPTASANLLASLVRRAGHKLRIREEGEGNSLKVTATLIRADDPEFPFEATWTLAKAKDAGLLGKGVWKQYPGQMLRSRAITEVCRQGAGDALFGVIYDPEELGGIPPQVTQVPASPDTFTPDEGGITNAQLAKIAILMREKGINGRDAAHMFVTQTIGRDIESSKELTKEEASTVIEALEGIREPVDEETLEAESVTVDAELVDPETGEVTQ